MEIKINLEKKYFFVILSALSVIILMLGVYAYRSSPANPAFFGHSASEV